VSAKN